jgi:hypothetical protein
MAMNMGCLSMTRFAAGMMAGSPVDRKKIANDSQLRAVFIAATRSCKSPDS